MQERKYQEEMMMVIKRWDNSKMGNRLNDVHVFRQDIYSTYETILQDTTRLHQAQRTHHSPFPLTENSMKSKNSNELPHQHNISPVRRIPRIVSSFSSHCRHHPYCSRTMDRSYQWLPLCNRDLL